MKSRRSGLLFLSSYGLLQVASIIHHVRAPVSRVPELLLVAAIAVTAVGLVFLGRHPPAAPVTPETPVPAPEAAGPLLVLAILWLSLGLQIYWGANVGNRTWELQRFAAVGCWTTLVLTSPFWLLLLPRFRARLARWDWTPILLVLFTLAATIKLAGILWDQRPAIDVWHGLQAGAAALSRGENPYTAPMSDAFQAGVRFGHPWLHYVYPPSTVLLTWPFVSVVGDVRYLYLLSDLASGFLLLALGRRLGAVHNRRACELGALLIAFHSHSFAKAWLEPALLPPLIGLALLELRRPAGRAQAVVAGLLLSFKQYLLFLAPLLVVHVRRLRWTLLMLACACATTVPFLLANPRALFEAVVTYHLDTPYRADGMTIVSLVQHTSGHMLPGWPGPVAALLILVAGAILAPRRGLTGVFAWTAASYLLLFGGSSYAFPNYYQFVMGLLLLAGILALAEPWPAETAGPASERAENRRSPGVPRGASRRRRRR